MVPSGVLDCGFNLWVSLNCDRPLLCVTVTSGVIGVRACVKRVLVLDLSPTDLASDKLPALETPGSGQ
uniref:Uncharacterized protein n=1 Tax=Knipowitschia caucasica TaxID=637954 RepID=A0AAV2M938_KNICA